jgi:hypothetical protein
MTEKIFGFDESNLYIYIILWAYAIGPYSFCALAGLIHQAPTVFEFEIAKDSPPP